MAQVGVGQVRRFTEGSLYFFFDPLAVLADFFFDPLLDLATSSCPFGKMASAQFFRS